jgi:hypothetical protein
VNKAAYYKLPPQVRADLQDVTTFLLTYGTVLDQEISQVIPYDPTWIAPYLQCSALHWMTAEPRMKEGHRKWLLICASRQTGKSATIAMAMYAKTAYRPSTFSALIADYRDRAEDLFRYVNQCHDNVPADVRIDTIPNRESRQLTTCLGSKIRTLSSDSSMVGIGRAFDNR